ncbi:MAG: DUF3782 domain-containing protein [Blastocatellia bacterium]
MTDQELKDLVAGLVASQKETDRMFKEIAEAKRKADEEFAEARKKAGEELAEERRKTEREIRRVNKQLGELGNKFGSFTEGMAWPSMEKVLHKHFGMNDISPRRKAHRNGETLEVGVLAYDNTGKRDELYLVEIKSHLKEEAIGQLLKAISDFPRFFPDLKDRKIYGLIAAVDIPDDVRMAVIKNGLYLARLNDETFKLLVPRNFKPKAFGPAAERNGAANGQTKKRKRRK